MRTPIGHDGIFSLKFIGALNVGCDLFEAWGDLRQGSFARHDGSSGAPFL